MSQPRFQFTNPHSNLVFGRYTQSYHGEELVPYKKRRRYLKNQSFTIKNHQIQTNLLEIDSNGTKSLNFKLDRSKVRNRENLLKMMVNDRFLNDGFSSSEILTLQNILRDIGINDDGEIKLGATTVGRMSDEQFLQASGPDQRNHESQAPDDDETTSAISIGFNMLNSDQETDSDDDDESDQSESSSQFSNRFSRSRSKKKKIKKEKKYKEFYFSYHKEGLKLHPGCNKYLFTGEKEMTRKNELCHLFVLKYLEEESRHSDSDDFLYKIHCFKNENYVIQINSTDNSLEIAQNDPDNEYQIFKMDNVTRSFDLFEKMKKRKEEEGESLNTKCSEIEHDFLDEEFGEDEEDEVYASESNPYYDEDLDEDEEDDW